MSTTTDSVGARLPRLDSGAKATGTATYCDDLMLPRMLHAAIAFSSHAHARIRGYDTTAARAVPGVQAVLTGADFTLQRIGAFVKDEPPLAIGKTCYLGEPVAVVAATTAAAARRAARLIDVDYEPLPAVLDVESALDPASQPIHEQLREYFRIAPAACHGNVLWECDIRAGDVEQAWKQCDVIVEGEFRTQAQHHVYMEPCSALADIDADGRITLWSSCQSVHLVQQRVADWLGLPMARIRAIAPHIGGGFGGKGGLHIQHLVAKLALATGRPVKLTLSRTEDFEIVRSRHPARIRMKTGATRDGVLLARSAEIVLDGGAYADESPAVLSFAVLMARGPYNIAHARISGQVVYTNKLRAGPYRGFGNPQVTFAGESQIDEIATRLGVDPIELRLRNAAGAGDHWIGGHPLPTSGFRACLETLRDAVKSRPASPGPAPGKRRGIGYAGLAHTSGLLASAAQVHVRTDGSAAVVTGVVDIGQGSSTILTQIAASTLQLPLERVSYAVQDSDSTPFNWKTAASRTTYIGGRAVLGAAEQARERLLAQAALMFECAAEDLELRPGGFVGVRGMPTKQLPFAQIAAHGQIVNGGPITGQHGLTYDGPRFDPKRATVTGFAFPNLGIYAFGAQAVEVDVDELTGEVTVLNAWSAHDVGRAINPLLVEGQIQGGVAQGLGLALHEEMVWESNGRLVNPSLVDYKVPGISELPDPIHTYIIEAPEPSGPYGAKGVGEACIVGIPAAVANAIAAATGRRVRTLPLTAERVLENRGQVGNRGQTPVL